MTKAKVKKQIVIKVYCPVETKIDLKNKAKNAKLTLSRYLLTTGLGYRVKSLLDHERLAELAKVNGDLGRLGGLLKLWLTDDARVARFDVRAIRNLLMKIERTQDQLRTTMKTVLMVE